MGTMRRFGWWLRRPCLRPEAVAAWVWRAQSACRKEAAALPPGRSIEDAMVWHGCCGLATVQRSETAPLPHILYLGDLDPGSLQPSAFSRVQVFAQTIHVVRAREA